MISAEKTRRVLVVEDDRDIAELLSLHLTELPAQVTLAVDGRLGLDHARQRGPWDAIVLDLNLPGLNGLDLCRELRAHGDPVPLLMLTARTSELDRVLGLELGADDYVVKPFSVVEVMARVRALIRRSALRHDGESRERREGELDLGPLRLDRRERRCWLREREVQLTPREFDLLWFFVRHPGRVFKREELLAEVWGYGHDGYDHTVNTHINRLRNKLGESDGEARFIQTVWGVGYRLEVPA